MNPDPLVPLDYDRVWSEGYLAGFEDSPRVQESSGIRATFALGLFVGVIIGCSLTIVIGHASAAPRTEPAPSVPVAAQARSGASLSPDGGTSSTAEQLTVTQQTGVRLPGAAPRPISGTASWYPARGFIAAAGPGLRHGDWRGRSLVVSANGRSVTVRLADWCACPRRLIDLSDDAFAALTVDVAHPRGNLGLGLLKVSVGSGGPVPTPPATDR